MNKKSIQEKVYDNLNNLINDIKKKEKKIAQLERRIDFLEGKEYGSELVKSGITRTISCVMKLLQRFPHSSNKDYNGKLVATDFIIKEELIKLESRLIKSLDD